jgi:hypothetical protein
LQRNKIKIKGYWITTIYVKQIAFKHLNNSITDIHQLLKGLLIILPKHNVNHKKHNKEKWAVHRVLQVHRIFVVVHFRINKVVKRLRYNQLISLLKFFLRRFRSLIRSKLFTKRANLPKKQQTGTSAAHRLREYVNLLMQSHIDQHQFLCVDNPKQIMVSLFKICLMKVVNRCLNSLYSP